MSYHTIIVVINELTVSTVAARYAIAMAASCKADLHLYAVCPVDADTSVHHNVDRNLEKLTVLASESGVVCTGLVEIGAVMTLLPKLVQSINADLVFYPLAPFKRYGADQQRTDIRYLLRSISCNLAIVRIVNMVRPHPVHLLVPLGRTVAAVNHRAVFVAALAHCFSAQVTLYHLTENLLEQSSPDIAQVRVLLEQLQITVLERNGTGTLGNAITLETITHHNDLIILGASERGTLRRIFFGNPAADVMYQPPCNTVLFRAAR